MIYLCIIIWVVLCPSPTLGRKDCPTVSTTPLFMSNNTWGKLLICSHMSAPATKDLYGGICWRKTGVYYKYLIQQTKLFLSSFSLLQKFRSICNILSDAMRRFFHLKKERTCFSKWRKQQNSSSLPIYLHSYSLSL